MNLYGGMFSSHWLKPTWSAILMVVVLMVWSGCGCTKGTTCCTRFTYFLIRIYTEAVIILQHIVVRWYNSFRVFTSFAWSQFIRDRDRAVPSKRERERNGWRKVWELSWWAKLAKQELKSAHSTLPTAITPPETNTREPITMFSSVRVR